MKIEGSLYRANLMLASLSVENHEQEKTFTTRLERCLVDLCHQLNIPMPLWMEKNTREFARFHQTIFFAEQFSDPIFFDRFQIRWRD